MRLLPFLVLIIQTVQCARILGIFYMPGYSHFTLGETLFKELAARGHQMTIVSGFPQKVKLKNYEDVPLTLVQGVLDAIRQPEKMMGLADASAINLHRIMYDFGNIMTDLTLQDESVQKLLKSNETFDLIILEQFLNEAHFGFMHHFKAPLILVSTTVSSYWTNNLMGNPTPYSLIPNVALNLSPRMNILQRTWNAFNTIFQSVYFHHVTLPEQDRILHKYFPDAPPITDLMYNASLIFLNSNPVLGSPVSLLPNMIEIGGFHVQSQKNRKLSTDLKKYLDDAKEGVVYFSMGSNLKSQYLDNTKLQHILRTFAKLKTKVLWKWEADDLPGKPDNVKIEKWLPQPAVLAHENVKLFITHGGKLSTTESIYYGKPVLGIPMFAEQFANIHEAVYSGYGRYVSYKTLTEKELTEVLTDMLENPKYANEAKSRSNALRSFKISPLENAINWVEYVIENKGAPHLKSEAAFLPWYQYIFLDVLLVILTLIWIITKAISVVSLKAGCKSKTVKEKDN